MSAARLRARWAALTGTGGAASIALALLVLGCVFVSVASPRVSLEYRTRALRSALAGTTALDRSVLANIDYTDFTVPFQGQIPASALANARGQLRANLAGIGLPLQPASADWSSLTTGYGVVGGAARSAFNGFIPPRAGGHLPRRADSNARLVAGAYPGPAAGNRLKIAVTVATARRFGLHVGSRLTTAKEDQADGRPGSSGRPIRDRHSGLRTRTRPRRDRRYSGDRSTGPAPRSSARPSSASCRATSTSTTGSWYGISRLPSAGSMPTRRARCKAS